MEEDWEIWFHQSGDLPSGIRTVESQLRASLRRLTKVAVTGKTLDELEAFAANVGQLQGTRIALISHVDMLDDGTLRRLHAITQALRRMADKQGETERPVHFSFIHRDPTTADAAAQHFRDQISRHESEFDRVVCIGPRMRAHLKSQWPRWDEHYLIELGAGMVVRPPLGLTNPILRPVPQKSNVRVLFGSPTSPGAMEKRGLDVFARAAGLVQAYFVERRVDITFVVSAIHGDPPSGTLKGGRAETAAQSITDWELLGLFEDALTTWAREEFGGPTEFEIRPLQERTDWLLEELGRADVFVLPSREEPFGLVAAEALSMGKPVVVSQNSGIGESLLDYAAESFLPVERYVCALTPHALARSIQEVIEDDRSRRLFHRIADGAYPRLSWGNAVHQLLNELQLPAQYYKPTVEISHATAQRVRDIEDATTQASMVLPIGKVAPAGGVLFNMPVAMATEIEEFDSNEGRRVTLETSGSTLFIRKCITEPSFIDADASISSVKDQWDHVSKALNEAARDSRDLMDIYPKIHHQDASELLMEYIDGGSLDRIASLGEATRLTGLATLQLLKAVVATGGPRFGMTAWDFCQHELNRRCTRLEQAMERLLDADKETLDLGPQLIEPCRSFFETCRQAAGGPSHIPIAIHGDFGLNNIVVKSDALRGDRIVFIDTRARWEDMAGTRVPLWDVAFDLATLYIFTAEIQPLLFQEFGFGVMSPLHGQRAVLVRLIQKAVKDSQYEIHDTYWRKRVEAACAVRLLGSVSVQLESARSDRVIRAKRIAERTRAFVGLATPIDWGPT